MRQGLRGLAAIGMSVAGLAAFGPGGALAGTLDQQQTNTSSGGFAVSSTESVAETFTAGLSGGLDQVDLHLSTTGGTPTVPLSVEIRDVTNTGYPGDNILAGRIVAASSVSATAAFVSIHFATPAPVAAGTQYAIVADSTASGSYYLWTHSSTFNPYHDGTGFGAAPPFTLWSPGALGEDQAFKTYVVVPPTSTPPTGERAAALAKCKKKRSHKERKKCKKRANLLPV